MSNFSSSLLLNLLYMNDQVRYIFSSWITLMCCYHTHFFFFFGQILLQQVSLHKSHDQLKSTVYTIVCTGSFHSILSCPVHCVQCIQNIQRNVSNTHLTTFRGYTAPRIVTQCFQHKYSYSCSSNRSFILHICSRTLNVTINE